MRTLELKLYIKLTSLIYFIGTFKDYITKAYPH